MIRVWVDHLPKEDESVILCASEHHHLTNVRRVVKDAGLEVLDGKGGLARANILECSRKRTVLKITERLSEARESPLALHLGLALPHQKSTLEEMLPALVQLGVTHLHLVETKFSGRVKGAVGKFMDRLSHIGLQALKQCGRLHLPVLNQPDTFDRVAEALIALSDRAIIFHPDPGGSPQKQALEKVSRLAMLVGPEGGFEEDEWRQAVAMKWESMGLGPRVLRMETAAIGACFWAQSKYGDFYQLGS